MKSDALTKSYEGMTSKQLATLAYIHNAKGNDLEVRRIFDAVPRKSYTMPDIEFSKHERALTVMGLCWACAYLKRRQMTAELEVSIQALLKINREDEIHKAGGFETLALLRGQTLGIMYALEVICDEYGIDLQAILKVTEVTDFDDKPQGEISQVIADVMIEGLRGILN